MSEKAAGVATCRDARLKGGKEQTLARAYSRHLTRYRGSSKLAFIGRESSSVLSYIGPPTCNSSRWNGMLTRSG